jgi:hypothetical protein
MRRFTALLDKFQPRVHSATLLVKTDIGVGFGENVFT